MKHFTLKLFLLIACLCGATSVGAETTNAVVKMTWVDYNNPDDSQGEIAAGSTARAGYNKISGGTVAFANTAWGENKITYLQVNASAVKGTIKKVTLSMDVSGSSDSKRTTEWGAGYNSSAWSADMTYNTADKSITTCGETVWTSTKYGNVFETKNIDITDALKDDVDKIVTVLIYEKQAAGGYVKNPTVTVEYLPAGAATTSITVKYVDENNVAVKPSVTVDNQAVGATYTLTNEDKASFTSGDFKYVYASDDAASKTIAADGSTVVTVVFSTIEKVSTLTVNYAFGDNIIYSDVLSTDNLWVGESYAVPFRMYLQKDGALYVINKNSSNPWYGDNVTLTKNNVVTKNLSLVNLNGGSVVFFVDLDDTNGENAGIRASYCSAYNNKAFTSEEDLPAGIYKFIVVCQNKGRNSTINVGETTVFSAANVDKNSWTTNTIENVTVQDGGKLALVKGGSNTIDCYDVIIAIKTGDFTISKTISAAGYATLYSDKALDFTNVEGLTAYIITGVSGTELTTQEVTKIPANTGVLLEGEAGTYDIPVAASAEPVEGNRFEGVLEATEKEAGIFVLMNSTAGVGFYKTSNTFTVGAGTAYLPADIVPAEVKALRINQEGTTAIQGINSEVNEANAEIYNLAGQRVAAPTKGIYVINGKKVMVK